MISVSKKNQIQDSDIKKISLEGLVELDRLCEREDLTYFLAFGSLLGAIRHKGFIPWDDDIDVLMPRNDYERLCAQWIMFQDTDWELFSYRNNNRFLMPYMKLCRKGTSVLPPRFSNGLTYGVSIDIFPLDFMNGESEAEVKDQILTIKNEIIGSERYACKTGVYEFGIKNSLKRMAKSTLYYTTPKRHMELLEKYRKYDDLLAKQSADDGIYAFYMYNRYDTIWYKRDFLGDNETKNVLYFEKIPFRAPADPEAVLLKTYGEYMKLPPLEQQKTVHTFKAYYTK